MAFWNVSIVVNIYRSYRQFKIPRCSTQKFVLVMWQVEKFASLSFFTQKIFQKILSCTVTKKLIPSIKFSLTTDDSKRMNC